ncbi:MAG TPA: penicillin-binding transpeptidase domain-containing protein [Ktedonobacterales bacterium]|nr:penicillin-binding transpeptidase domain-containing protein [Ktedonobacterales bacterium]
MNTMTNGAIRRLLTTFLILFLILSGVAAYVQIFNQAFINGPVLAHGSYDPRICPPYDTPIRGTIFDRNGVKLAWTVEDTKANCGYRREYDPRVATSGLAPLLGYFSTKYGTAGVESAFNDALAGIQHGVTPNDVTDKLLHRQRHGQDIHLTIDINLQVEASSAYDNDYLSGLNGLCQPAGSNPPGSMIVEDPHTGEILAMVSKPSYDPNQIDTKGYFQQLQADPGLPLLNRASQGLYAPGSTFKTLTLLAALDTGTGALDNQYSKDDALNYVVNGEPIRWDDYYAGAWQSGRDVATFPMPLIDGYAYSDNVIFARQAVATGADQWLAYMRRYGIATPGTNVDPIPFDAPYKQSSAYNAIGSNGQPQVFNDNLLAESGFGQGQLLISPLTMAEITSSVAADGLLYSPHVLLGGDSSSQQVISVQTAAGVRKGMWAVVDHGTGDTYPDPHGGPALKNSPTQEGGKSGTAQLEEGSPQSWWISLAPDDQFPNGGGPAKMVITVNKERSGDGGCQAWVANSTYTYAMNHHIGPFGG